MPPTLSHEEMIQLNRGVTPTQEEDMPRLSILVAYSVPGGLPSLNARLLDESAIGGHAGGGGKTPGSSCVVMAHWLTDGCQVDGNSSE